MTQPEISAIADAMEAHNWDDWYHALLTVCLDEGHDVTTAIEMASTIFDEQAEESEPASDDAAAIFGKEPVIE